MMRSNEDAPVYSPTTAADFVYYGVRLMLMAGELKPGDRVVQRELAEKFGTSNIPVIEATRRLEQDGLLISFTNKGAQVPHWTRRDIEGAFLAREALEGIACGLFVQFSSEDDKRILSELNERFNHLAASGSAAQCREADVALHTHIVRASGSRVLQKTIENSCAVTLTILSCQLSAQVGTGCKGTEAGGHDELVKALICGDAQAATEAGREHVRIEYQEAISHLGTPANSLT